MCKPREAARIIVAVPVAGASVAREIGALVDEIVVLKKPHYFRAVVQVYRNWYDVSDQEVPELMHTWKVKRAEIREMSKVKGK